jgi:hypothetical protein
MKEKRRSGNSSSIMGKRIFNVHNYFARVYLNGSKVEQPSTIHTKHLFIDSFTVAIMT